MPSPLPDLSRPILPADRLERVEGWSRSVYGVSTVYRPSTVEQISDVFAVARRTGRTICLRGAGRSYGDASLGREEITLDLTRMNRILSWNPTTGVLECEPGVLIQQIWEYVIGDGWWPSVVPGTMFVTVGGALAANIHGKNNFRSGTIGEYTREFDLLLPDGSVRTVRADSDPELFYAAIGGLGLLGVITRARLQMRRIYSGTVHATQYAGSNLDELFALFRQKIEAADHAVGWIDGFARGRSLGRGLLETVSELPEGADTVATRSLQGSYQRLSDTIPGGLPKSLLWKLLRPLFNDLGMRVLNTAQFAAGTLGSGKVRPETHAGAGFKLDYLPNWKLAYGRHGLIQFQSGVPDSVALDVLSRQLETCQRAGLVPYLCVLKRHRPDPFLLSYLCDGWSLALDFKVTERNRARLEQLYDELAEFTLAAGGRFYFVKDGTLRRERLAAFRTEPRFVAFLALKARLDPESILQTDLYRRLLAPAGDY